MSASTLAVIVVTAALWPFARGGDVRNAEPTIGSLHQHGVEIREDQSLPDAGRRAREHYQQYLQLDVADDEMTAEALRRLADLALEAEEIEQLELEQASFSGEAHAQAVQLYRERLARFPAHPANDQVRYQLARAQELSGDGDGALATLDELIALQPRSAVAHEVQFRRGELLFSRARYHHAELAYAAVLAHPAGGEFYQQSAYKRGWSLFKQGLMPETLDAFFNVLTRHSADGVELDMLARPARELLEDSLHVMAMSLAALDGVETLHALLAVSPARTAWAAETHSALGALYLDQERYTDTYAVLRAFVEHSPMHARAPALSLEGMAALRRGGFAMLLLGAKEDYVNSFGLDQPFWQLHEREDHGAAVEALASALTTLARHHHALVLQEATIEQADPQRDQAWHESVARATASAAATGEAIRWYGKLLDFFPAADDAAEHHFLLAELLLRSGDLPAAVRAFEATAYDYPPHERSAEAAYAALLARDQQLSVASYEAIALQRARIDAAERFAGRFPAHPQALDVLSDAAERAFELDDTPVALRLARAVTAVVPAAPARLQRVAWRIQGHVLFDLMSYAEAEHAYWQVHALSANTELAELEARLAATVYRQGESAREIGEHEQAAMHFLRVGERLPAAEIRPVAQFDAAMELLRVPTLQRAVDVMLDFRTRYPGHALGGELEINLASAYEALAQPGLAGSEYRRMAARLTDAHEQRGVLWRAAELLEQDGDTRATEEVLQQIATQHAGAFDEALEARQQLLEMAIARDDETLALTRARALVDFEATGPGTPRSRTLAARASLSLADAQGRSFHATPLVMPLTDSLAVKRRRMEAALAGYAQAAGFGIDEVVTAATYATAELYNGLARSLMASPRPLELDELALEQYEMLLEEQAFPFEEQAIDIHERNARRSALGLYDQWIAASFEQLAELMPGRYARVEQGETHVARIR
jgi:tetratricopeptide (TPR) repeat protein